MTVLRQVLRPGDLVVVALIMALTALSFWAVGGMYDDASGPLTLLVSVGGEVVLSLQLSEAPDSFSVEVPLPRGGEAVVTVAQGSVRVEQMPDWLCPRHICSHHIGAIDRPGRSIICVPNRLVVELVGARRGELDGITR